MGQRGEVWSSGVMHETAGDEIMYVSVGLFI